MTRVQKNLPHPKTFPSLLATRCGRNVRKNQQVILNVAVKGGKLLSPLNILIPATCRLKGYTRLLHKYANVLHKYAVVLQSF